MTTVIIAVIGTDVAVVARMTVIYREEMDEIEIGGGIAETVVEVQRTTDLMIVKMRAGRGDGIGIIIAAKMMNLIPEVDQIHTEEDAQVGDTRMKRMTATIDSIQEEEASTMTIENPPMILNLMKNRRVSSSEGSETEKIDNAFHSFRDWMY
mmetsp:Transcript_22449/g.55650  ORF Transcript_22449/g.55650 Transcript_22449/m.55650 type:complete len:152 (-) Transcript_22449:89-544(-)